MPSPAPGQLASNDTGNFLASGADTNQAGEMISAPTPNDPSLGGFGNQGAVYQGVLGTPGTNVPGLNPLYYQQASATAGDQYTNYTNLAQNTYGVPVAYNPTGAASRSQLAGVNTNFGALENTLANTAAGGGINAGQATQTAGLNQGIAAQLAAARGGHGGYQLGNAMGAQGQAGANNLGLASSAAAARAQQINQAYAGLGSAYAGQGGLALSQYGTEQQMAQQQANMALQQNQMNQQNQLANYNNALNEQGQYLNVANNYIGQAQNEQALNENAQQQNNALANTITGTAAKVGSTALAAALA